MTDDRTEPETAPGTAPGTPPDTPVGRRVVLGLIGVGAVGVLAGARVQDWLERVLGPLISKDGTGLAAFLPLAAGETPPRRVEKAARQPAPRASYQTGPPSS